MEFDELSNRVIGCAIEVHRELGPGLPESTYEQCLAHELKRNGIAFRLQHPQPVKYKGMRLDCGYRVDVLGEETLILLRKHMPTRSLWCPFRTLISLTLSPWTLAQAIVVWALQGHCSTFHSGLDQDSIDHDFVKNYLAARFSFYREGVSI